MDNSEYERWKMEHESKLAEYDAENARRLEMFKSVITAGQSALKSAILINGGAAVAMLAFAGSIWGKSLAQCTVKYLLAAMGLFVVGVLLGAVASGLTYLVQRAYAQEREKTGNRLNVGTISCVVVAYVLFLVGSGVASIAILKQFGQV